LNRLSDKELDLTTLQPLMTSLQRCLEENDTLAADILDELCQQAPGIEFVINIKSIQEAMSHYDFDKASELLITELDKNHLTLPNH